MATWHQSRNPVPLYHATEWTIVSDPPGNVCSLWLESTRKAAYERLALWKANGRDIQHSYILPPASWDTTPRYVPGRIMTLVNGCGRVVPVRWYRIYDAGNHPKGCPIDDSMTAIQLATDYGSRWFGFDRAYINSELRVVVSGFDKRDEIRSKWEVCKCP